MNVGGESTILGCLVQNALDVYVGRDLESPHQKEMPQSFNSLPRLHHRQAERPKGFQN